MIMPSIKTFNMSPKIENVGISTRAFLLETDLSIRVDMIPTSVVSFDMIFY